MLFRSFIFSTILALIASTASAEDKYHVGLMTGGGGHPTANIFLGQKLVGFISSLEVSQLLGIGDQGEDTFHNLTQVQFQKLDQFIMDNKIADVKVAIDRAKAARNAKKEQESNYITDDEIECMASIAADENHSTEISLVGPYTRPGRANVTGSYRFQRTRQGKWEAFFVPEGKKSLRLGSADKEAKKVLRGYVLSKLIVATNNMNVFATSGIPQGYPHDEILKSYDLLSCAKNVSSAANQSLKAFDAKYSVDTERNVVAPKTEGDSGTSPPSGPARPAK